MRQAGRIPFRILSGRTGDCAALSADPAFPIDQVYPGGPIGPRRGAQPGSRVDGGFHG